MLRAMTLGRAAGLCGLPVPLDRRWGRCFPRAPQNRAFWPHPPLNCAAGRPADWGDTEAKKTAAEMKFSPEFVLALGTTYDDGVKSVDDPQFKAKFEDTLTHLPQCRYVCAGNHDYYGGSKGIEAEIQYSKVSSR